MRKLHLVSTVLIGVLLASQIISAQQLTVENAGKKVVLSRADIEMLPRVRVTATGHSADTKFEGVTVWSVLEKAGVSFAESMNGKRLASCLLVEAADGYRVVIALSSPQLPFYSDQLPSYQLHQQTVRSLGCKPQKHPVQPSARHRNGNSGPRVFAQPCFSAQRIR
jgi:hypothetical protein